MVIIFIDRSSNRYYILPSFYKKMQKKPKQSITLPQLPQVKHLNLQITHDKQPHKPKLHRLVVEPITLSTRMLRNATILESILNKRTYEDTRQELKQQQISYFLRESKSVFERDDRNKGRVGREAQLKYYENYKKLDKLLCKKKANRSSILQSLDNDPTLPVLQVAEDLRVLPCCMGFIKNTGDANILNLKGQKFGDKYIKAISAGIKQAKIIDNCQFSNNRITDEGLRQISDNLSNQIIKIDVSTNKISKFPSKLLSLIIEPQARLQFLNLQNNLISDKAADLLFRSVVVSKHMKYLNLRKNMLTKNCSEPLSELILRTASLEELYIGMNRINEEAAVAVIEALEDNRTIRVFDYCMNKLGDSQTNSTPANAYKIAKLLSRLVSTNKILIHVDFSSNNFNEQETKIIAEGLNKNKKIYGLHFHGNNGYIDSKGFLHPEDKKITTLHSIMGKNINSYDIVFRRQAMHMDPTKFRNVCWICEGWHEQLFKFKVPEPREDGKNHVYIHFDFEQFEPRLINITDVKVKYKAMVPPRRYRYFFTWNNKQYTDPYIARNENKTDQKPSIHSESTNMKLEIPMTFTYNFGNESVSFKVEEVSCRSSKPTKIVNSYDEIIVSVLPRQEGLVSKKEKKAWSYKDSVWAKQWKLQDEQLTKNCFEKDWKCSKLTNFIKNQGQQDKVKQILYKNYKLIKELYRYYSSWSPFNSDIWAVSNNAFTQFCYLAKIISKDTPLTIIDLTFITTNSISGTDFKGNSLVPERGLVRFQLMQGLVRLSEEKFKKNGLADSILGSVTNMMKDHIQPLADIPLCNSEKWRLKQYFIEQNDNLIKKYRPIFTQIYKKNSKMKVKPGNKPFMCLAEFKSIIERVGVAGTYVLQRDIFLSFNCSMMTQVDQLENQRFIRMTQIQFIEAIARCAYILPATCKVQDIFENPTPFYAKFEWMIHQLKIICSDDIKNMFSDQTSIFNKSEDD